SVMFTAGARSFSLAETGGALALYVSLVVVGVVVALVGNFAFLLVMGGASRNLVLHLLWNEPVSARAIYRNVRSRFWGLVGALLLMLLFAGAAAMPVGFAWMMLLSLAVVGVTTVAGGGAFGVVLLVVFSASFTLAALFAYFWIVGRVAYVPQVMLVEGRKATDAFGRSMTLARGNVRRLTAMFLFTTFATYSALMLLAVPLGWYGYLRGMSPVQFGGAELPLWYSIGWQVITQTSKILLAPVWMLGLSLLYVDERVRHEGYDIELLARRRLGDMPDLPGGGVAPLAPAVHTAETRKTQDAHATRGATPPHTAPATPQTQPTIARAPSHSILGLDERRDG
ncbi:MAG: hypothetical protein ABR563_14800, partial [Pyrinomonadaceae bacterium]